MRHTALRNASRLGAAQRHDGRAKLEAGPGSDHLAPSGRAATRPAPCGRGSKRAVERPGGEALRQARTAGAKSDPFGSVGKGHLR